MKISNKAIGLVAAVVLLQLALAPTAMARLPRVSNETIVMVTEEEGVQRQRYYCGESCKWTPCTNPSCRCMSGSCFIIR